MKTTSRIAAALIATALPFTLSACGNSAADQAKASIKANIIKDAKTSTDKFKLSDSQAGCFANTVVDKIGVKQLQTYKMVDSKNQAIDNALDNVKMSKADATSLVDAMFSCTNGGAVIVDEIKKSITDEASGVPAAVATCIKSKLSTPVVRDVMIAGFSGGDAAQAVQTAAASCLTGAN